VLVDYGESMALKAFIRGKEGKVLDRLIVKGEAYQIVDITYSRGTMDFMLKGINDPSKYEFLQEKKLHDIYKLMLASHSIK
jgi:hypothetical protein